MSSPADSVESRMNISSECAERQFFRGITNWYILKGLYTKVPANVISRKTEKCRTMNERRGSSKGRAKPNEKFAHLFAFNVGECGMRE